MTLRTLLYLQLILITMIPLAWFLFNILLGFIISLTAALMSIYTEVKVSNHPKVASLLSQYHKL